MANSTNFPGKSPSNPLAGVRNWDAQSRTTTKWQGLHQDTPLWFPDGDLFVFLFEKGQSQRKPSFHIRMADLRLRNFDTLVERCTLSKTVYQSPPKTQASTLRARMAGRKAFYELYLPPPPGVDNVSALEYHLTTRNFFAFMYDVPMVGKSLGRSLVAALERINDYRPLIEQNRMDLMTYLESQGYYDFRMCADHALAALHLAEVFEMPALWKNAFAHSVGMLETLPTSGEYQHVSRLTKTLIMRANVDMEAHLRRVTGSLGTFFEDLDSGASFGLNTQAARDHLDRFRSFLISFHIERHGFWPPRNLSRQNSTFPKDTLTSLYLEFRCLYQFLVDLDSSPVVSRRLRPTIPGFNVELAIQTFDEKNDLEPLPHHLPLLPRPSADGLDIDDDEGVRPKMMPFGRGKVDKVARRKAAWKTLADATNYDPHIYATLIVKRYIEFEREILIETEEEKTKLSLADGRRIRWLLVYSTLQILISVIKAPKDVSDTEGVDYPLCCKIPKTMPWNMKTPEMPRLDSDSGIAVDTASLDTTKAAKSETEKPTDHSMLATSSSSASFESSSREGGSLRSSATSEESAVAAIYLKESTPNSLNRPPPAVIEKSQKDEKTSRRRSLLSFFGRKPSASETDTKTLHPGSAPPKYKMRSMSDKTIRRQADDGETPNSSTHSIPDYHQILVGSYGDNAGREQRAAEPRNENMVPSPLSSETNTTTTTESSTVSSIPDFPMPMSESRPVSSHSETTHHGSTTTTTTTTVMTTRSGPVVETVTNVDAETPEKAEEEDDDDVFWDARTERADSSSTIQPISKTTYSESSSSIPNSNTQTTTRTTSPTVSSSTVTHLQVPKRKPLSVVTSQSSENVPRPVPSPVIAKTADQIPAVAETRGRKSHLPSFVKRTSSVSRVQSSPSTPTTDIDERLKALQAEISEAETRSRSQSRTRLSLASANTYTQQSHPVPPVPKPISQSQPVPPTPKPISTQALPETRKVTISTTPNISTDSLPQAPTLERSKSKGSTRSRILSYWKPNSAGNHRTTDPSISTSASANTSTTSLKTSLKRSPSTSSNHTISTINKGKAPDRSPSNPMPASSNLSQTRVYPSPTTSRANRVVIEGIRHSPSSSISSTHSQTPQPIASFRTKPIQHLHLNQPVGPPPSSLRPSMRRSNASTSSLSSLRSHRSSLAGVTEIEDEDNAPAFDLAALNRNSRISRSAVDLVMLQKQDDERRGRVPMPSGLTPAGSRNSSRGRRPNRPLVYGAGGNVAGAGSGSGRTSALVA